MNVILDVNPNRHDLEWEESFLRKCSVSVIGCSGTETEGGYPILRGDVCPKLEVADGVIFQLDLDRLDHRWILGNYIRILNERDVALRVVVTPAQRARWANMLQHVETITPPITVEKLDEFVQVVDGPLGPAQRGPDCPDSAKQTRRW